MEPISKSHEWNICLNLLLEDDVSEITTNGPDLFFAKKRGKRIKIDVAAADEEAYMDGIERGLVPHVKSPWPFQRNSYLFEGPLRYRVTGDREIRGRCHVVLPPACDYPQVTIAKKSTVLPSLDSIAERGSMSTEMLLFIKRAVEADLTMVISGGTGAGKTTMLEAMSKLFRHDMRIGVAEDAPELLLEQPNVAYLHSVPWQPGMNPNDVATLSWVVAQYQRMRTDKIIIGETRGPEFADFLIAANSGMDGSMTTMHANDPSTCLDKMTNFAMKASNNPITLSINTDIANSIDLIVQLIILPDGRHRVGEIREITRTISGSEAAKITTASLYKYNNINDTFEKNIHMSDELRKKFFQKGVDIAPFLNAKIGEEQSAHMGFDAEKRMVDRTPETEGLPKPLPGPGLPRMI